MTDEQGELFPPEPTLRYYQDPEVCRRVKEAYDNLPEGVTAHDVYVYATAVDCVNWANDTNKEVAEDLEEIFSQSNFEEAVQQMVDCDLEGARDIIADLYNDAYDLGTTLQFDKLVTTYPPRQKEIPLET